jgi:hypothetical protein
VRSIGPTTSLRGVSFSRVAPLLVGSRSRWQEWRGLKMVFRAYMDGEDIFVCSLSRSRESQI